jgi:hypothetical protein
MVRIERYRTEKEKKIQPETDNGYKRRADCRVIEG